MDFAVRVSTFFDMRFSVWLRGVEVEVSGHVESADFVAGLLEDSLVIEELRPVDLTSNSRWKCPDIDELLDSGEYYAIEAAFFDTYDSYISFQWYVFWGIDSDPAPVAEHEHWREYWIGARTHTLTEPLDAYRDLPPIVENE